MKVADHLAAIFVEPPLFFLSDLARCYYLMTRAYELGWRFRAAEGLEVKKPDGSGDWHLTDGEWCDCVGRRRFGWCSHSELVGRLGVEVARQVCGQFDFSGRHELLTNRSEMQHHEVK